MKHLLILLFLFSGVGSFAQATDKLKIDAQNKSNNVSFVTTLDITKAQKGGFFLNGYFVEIDYEQAKKISGKRIRITGLVTIVKGLKNDPEYKKGIQKSGWLENTKHIYNPQIKILN